MTAAVVRRSLLIAQELLNTKEIVLMHHTGMGYSLLLSCCQSPSACLQSQLCSGIPSLA